MSNILESIRTLVIGCPTRNIAGEITQIKTTNENGEEQNDYITSNFAELTLQKPRNTIEIDFTSVDSILNRITAVTHKTRFTSIFISKDEITGENYGEDCPELLIRRIPGGQIVYYPPAGVIYCHTDNLLLFRCVCINFMIIHQIIPFGLTSLQEKQIFKINRSGGFIQRAYLDYNSGLRVSNNTNKIILNVGFNTDQKQIINEENPFVDGIIDDVKSLLDYTKSVILDEFCQLNNIDLIDINYQSLKFTPDEIDAQNEICPALAIVLEKFNEKLKEYFESFPTNPYLKIHI